MSPAEIKENDKPSQGSQITLILLILLVVLGLGALYFRFTGTVL